MNDIIVFDGYCNFFFMFVDFILKRDKRKRFLFTASQSEKGKDLLQHRKIEDAETVLLITGEQVYYRSTAAIRILSGLGKGWRLAMILLVIPKFVRDSVYTFIAARRRRWWGTRNECRLPSADEQDRFL